MLLAGATIGGAVNAAVLMQMSNAQSRLSSFEFFISESRSFLKLHDYSL